MPVAAGVGIASAVSGIYAAHKSSESSDKAAQLQSTASDKATALAQQQEAERKSEFDQQQAQAKLQWDTEQANKAPYRQISSDALLRVRDLLGLPQGAPLPSSAAPTGTPSSAGAPTATATGSGGSAADLKALIDGGMNPQQAASVFNQKYGRSTGNEAVYYAPSAQTSGKAVLGLPDAYLSQEPQGWAITNRGSATPRTAMAAAMPTSLVSRTTLNPATMGPATQPNYTPIIPFSQLMNGVRS